MRFHVIGAVIAALLAPALSAAEKNAPSVLLPVGYVKASAPSCGCGSSSGSSCAAPAGPSCCATPMMVKPSCVFKPKCSTCGTKPRCASCVMKPSCNSGSGCAGSGYNGGCTDTCQIFGGPCCGRLFPTFPGWCSYFGRGVDSLLPCGRACGRPVVCNNPEVCDEVCGCGGCGGGHRGCGALPPAGYCRQKSAFRLWPQFQCCPDLAGGLTGCNSGACGGCRGGRVGHSGHGGSGCGCQTCNTSATSGNGAVLTYPPAYESHGYPAAPDMPNLRHQQQPTPAPEPEPLLPKAGPKAAKPVPEIPVPMPEMELPGKKDDPFGDDNNLPPVEKDVLNLAPPTRLPTRAAGSTKPVPAPRIKTAKLAPVNLDIVPAVHVDESVMTAVKSRPVTGPRLTAPSKPIAEEKSDRPMNPLRK